jgi:hypothetical protein
MKTVLRMPIWSDGDFAPNAFIRIGQDSKVTFTIPQVEMGQGIYTALSMRQGAVHAYGPIAHKRMTSLQHPEWTPAFDHEPTQAMKSRKAILDRVATDRVMAMGYHIFRSRNRTCRPTRSGIPLG